MARAKRIDPSIAEMHRKTAELAEAADARGDAFLRYLYEMSLNYLEQEASNARPEQGGDAMEPRGRVAEDLVEKLRQANPIG